MEKLATADFCEITNQLTGLRRRFENVYEFSRKITVPNAEIYGIEEVAWKPRSDLAVCCVGIRARASR